MLILYRYLKSASTDHGTNDSIETCFVLSFRPDDSTISDNIPSEKHSKYGRILKSTLQTGYEQLHSEIIHSISYDEDLDILTVFYTHVNLSPNMVNEYMIGLFDNQNGRLIKQFVVDEDVSEADDHEWNVYYNETVIVCMLEYVSSKSKTVCLIYRLCEDIS